MVHDPTSEKYASECVNIFKYMYVGLLITSNGKLNKIEMDSITSNANSLNIYIYMYVALLVTLQGCPCIFKLHSSI